MLHRAILCAFALAASSLSLLAQSGALFEVEATPVAYLKASEPGKENYFGRAVAISGNTLVAGALGYDGPGNNPGAAFVFERVAGRWTGPAFLQGSNTDGGFGYDPIKSGDHFGAALAVDGDTLVVGAPAEDGVSSDDPGGNSNRNYGAAYVFVRGRGGWQEQAYLKAADPGILDWFGSSVAVQGDLIAVGAPGESGGSAGVDGDQLDNSQSMAGAVYLFRRRGESWEQVAYLKASDPLLGSRFGGSVALDGRRLLVGAPYALNDDLESPDGELPPRPGAAYVFVRRGETWKQEAKLQAANPSKNDLFGGSVDLAGGTAVVGAYWEDGGSAGVDGPADDDSLTDSGAAYVFERRGAHWDQTAYLKAFNPDEDDRYGAKVVATPSRVFVGALAESSSTPTPGGPVGRNDVPGAGDVYVYARSPFGWFLERFIKSRPSESDGFGHGLDGDGRRLVVGAQYESSAASGVNGDASDNSLSTAGAAYVFELR